jgi:hypothetical protein
MRLADVNFSTELLRSWRLGNLVVFAGAGVSIPPPSSYPDFRTLALDVAEGTLALGSSEPIDRYLGRLVGAKVKVHDRVKRILSKPQSQFNHVHLNLIRLFDNPKSLRLVTTNFDVHFTSAASTIWNSQELEIYSAPALPLGNAFNGIVHLHGSVAHAAQRLVLTDADFGRAYLTEGWATQFLQRLFGHYTVLFVGYSHDDVVMTYLARGLPPSENGPTRFALTAETDDEKWLYLGIHPIRYPRSPGDSHEALGVAIEKWAALSRTDAIGHESKIREIVERPVSVDAEELDYLEDSLSQPATARFFVRYAKTPDWLKWVESKSIFSELFSLTPLSEAGLTLAQWFALNFVCELPDEAIALIQRKGPTINPTLVALISHALFAKHPETQILEKWIPLLVSHPIDSRSLDLLNYVFAQVDVDKSPSSALLLFDCLTKPTLILKRNSWKEISDQADAPDFEADVDGRGEIYWLIEGWTKHLKPRLATLADQLLVIALKNLAEANNLLRGYGKITPTRDPVSSHRNKIEVPTDAHSGVMDLLIDVVREIHLWNVEHRVELANALTTVWIASENLTLRRIAIYGLTKNQALSADYKLDWILKNELIYKYPFKHELFALLADCYGSASANLRRKVLDVAKQRSGDETDEYEKYNLLLWLQRVAPLCAETKTAFDQVAKANPQFGPREHPDLDFWIGGVRSGWESPVEADSLLDEDPEARLNFYESYSPEKPFGPSRDGLLQRIQAASTRNYDWGFKLASALAKEGKWESDLWNAVIGSWNQTLLSEEQWHAALQLIERGSEGFAKVQLRNLAELLEDGIQEKERDLPRSAYETAKRLSELLWRVAKEQESDREDATDWLMAAINHPSGKIVTFRVRLLSKLRKDAGDDWKEIPENERSFFCSIVKGSSYSCQLGRVILSSQFSFFYALDPEWTLANVLPLLEWAKNERTAMQCWHGFLFWSGWTRQYVTQLLPLYLQGVKRFQTQNEEFQRIHSEHLSGIACLSDIEPWHGGWLKAFVADASPSQKESWARGITINLQRAGDANRQAWWTNWISDYWNARIDGIPSPLLPNEVSEMVRWVIHFGPSMPVAVELLLKSPAPNLKYSHSFYELRESAAAKEYPVAGAKLLLYLLQREEEPLYDVGSITKVFKVLASRNRSIPELKQICEVLALRGDAGARELRRMLDQPPLSSDGELDDNA